MDGFYAPTGDDTTGDLVAGLWALEGEARREREKPPAPAEAGTGGVVR